jgi:subtilisin family serine protease
MYVLFHCAGKGVTIYVLDSGIRASHQEFQPWDSSNPNRITVGPDFVDKDGVGEALPVAQATV